MSFLNPILLFGLAGISVPVIIHLLNRRQIQRVPWAAMRFLQLSVETNQRRLQIEDLLLLILRILVIALCAFALARPTLNAAGGLMGQPAAVTLIIVDHSYSMTQTAGVSSRFDLAKRAGAEVIDALSNGSSVVLWMGSDGYTPLIAEPTRDMTLARKTLESAKPSDRATDLLPAVQAGIEMLKRAPSTAKDLYIITDGQKAGFRQLAAVQQLLQSAKGEVNVTILLIDQRENANLAVTALVQSAGVAAIDRPLRFSAVVTNFGDQAVNDVRVSLRVASSDAVDRATTGAAPVDDATISVIEPGQSKAVSLFGRLKTDGTYAVTASIAPDRVPADDQLTVVVRGTKRIKVLLADGDTGREARDAETFFLRALFASSGSPGQPPLIDTVQRSASSLATEALDDYDAVVLANVADVSHNTADALAAYVGGGGGLIVFPGDRVDRNFYNSQLAARLDLLPATLGEPQGDAKAQTRLTSFSDSALDHPLAALWKDPAAGRLSSINLYRYTPLTPTKPRNKNASTPRVVLKLLDGTPAVMEKSFGEGRVIQFNTAADTAWSDLPAKPGIFVPLLYRAVGSIVEKRDEALNLTVGQRLAYQPEPQLLGQETQIKYLNDEAAVADVRRVELINNRPMLVTEPLLQAGTYEMKIGDQPPMLFAAQIDSQESNLESLSSAETEQLGQVANVLAVKPDTDLAAGLRKERTGNELFLPLAILLLTLAVTESVLSMWFSRSR
ncbi:MAG TPA: BatA domain-containing protein [Tepidisphaeraceae bacterium]